MAAPLVIQNPDLLKSQNGVQIFSCANIDNNTNSDPIPCAGAQSLYVYSALGGLRLRAVDPVSGSPLAMDDEIGVKGDQTGTAEMMFWLNPPPLVAVRNTGGSAGSFVAVVSWQKYVARGK